VPSISDNGQFVILDGKYTSGGNPTSDVLLYNNHTQQVTLVQSDAGNGTISGDGQVIAFEAFDGSSFYGPSIVVEDASSNTVTVAIGNSNPNDFNASFGDPSLSDDGRFVSFWSTANDIAVTQGSSTFTFQTGNTAESSAEVYVYDTLTHTLQEASGTLGDSAVQGDGDSGTLDTGTNNDNSWRSEMSGNGRFVVFQSTANNLANNVGDAANDVSNIFVYDTHTGKVTAVTDADGSIITGSSIRPSISADGKYITFSSNDSDLPGANGGLQTYMVAIDPVTGALGTPELLSAGFPGADNGQNDLASSVSDGGGVTAFGGAAFAFDMNQGQATLVGGGKVQFSGGAITDFNGSGDTLTLTITVQHGTLTPVDASLPGLTIVGGNDGSHGTLEFTGSLAAVNAALQSGVVYTPTGSGDDTIALTASNAAGETATMTSQFDPNATDPSGIFVSESNTGQYDIFLSDQQTINVTADTTINDGATIEGGLITVASGVILTLNDVTDTDTSIHDFTGTIAFTGSSTLEGIGIFGGTNQSGQPTGNVTVSAGVTLILDDVVFKNVAVTVDSDGATPSFQIDAGHTLTWAGASSFGGPGTVIIDNNGHIVHDGTLSIGFTEQIFEGTGTDTQNGGNTSTEQQTLTNEGNTFDGYGTFGSNVTIDNEAGRFDADVAGQALVLDTGHQIVNDGTFIADGGILKVLDAVTGSGSAIIEHGGTLELGNSDQQTVTFDDASTLQLDQQQYGNAEAYTGTIDGVVAGDVFDLTNFGTGTNDQFRLSASYNANTNTTTLTVTDTSLGGQPTSAPIILSGNYANPNDFSVTSDGHGGIDVAAVPAASFDPTYLTFSGAGQSATGPVPSTQTDNVTIAGWIDWNGSNASGSQEVLFYNGATNSQGYGLITQVTPDGLLDVQGLAGGQTVLDGETALSANQWYFVALTQVGGTFQLYVDGVEDTDLTPASSGVGAIGSGAQMQIGGLGAFDEPEVFSGSIADVSVWNTALSQSQIQALQGTYLSGNEAGLAGYYPLSDGSGATAADAVNSAGNLTLSGNPTWVVDGGNSWSATGGDVLENTSATIVGLNLSNVNASDMLTVTLDVSHGTLMLGNTNGLSGETGLGTGIVTLTGTEAEIDAALASGVVYTPTTGFTGTDRLAFTANDGGVSSNPESLTINVAPLPDYWGSVDFPAIVEGEHLFGVNPQNDSSANMVVLAYNSSTDYATGATSFTYTPNVESLDPFFLPGQHAPQVASSSFTVQAPGRYNLIVPNIDYSASNSPDGVAGTLPIGIYIFKGDVDGTNGIWQVIATPDANGDGGVTFGDPTEIATSDETIFNLKESQHSSSGIATSYSIVWDQFSGSNATTGSYGLDIQLVGINGSATSPANVFTPTTILQLPIAASGVSEADLPAWDFKPAAGSYVLALAQSSGGTYNVIHFQGYSASAGTVTTDAVSFTVHPNLNAYAPGATNEIVQPIVATLSPYPGQVAEALQFAQSPDNGNDYFVVWNETVTDINGSHDQVEFAVLNPTGPTTYTTELQSTFQIADGQPQNVRVGEFLDPTNHSQDDVVVAYGDDTGTHILEYAVTDSGQNVTLLASFTDPTTQAFDNLTIMGDGRIAITYDDLVNPSPDETSQYNFKIFDLRTQGLDNPTLSASQNNYIAGTHFSDVVTGANGVNNEYYFVGQDSANGAAPSDTFHGGLGGWNIAIFADARSDYSISTQIENGAPNITTITSNGDDPAHTGSLAVANVAFLAFDPASDPTPQNNIIDVNGGTFVILGGNSAVTIENGATAEFDSAASGQTAYAGNAAFEGTVGTLQVDQLNELTGQISGIVHGDANQVLELDGFGAHNNDQFTVTPTLDGNDNTVLTVTDTSLDGPPSESVTLVGNYTGDTWTAVDDGNGGVNVFDPPAASSNGDGSAGFMPTNEQITFGPNGEVTYTIDSSTSTGMTATQSQTTTANSGVVLGGPGNDTFVFQPGMGGETIANFNPQQDTLSFDHFTAAQTAQELQSLIMTDTQGEAVINLGHNDSVTLTGVTPAQLQQAIQAGQVLSR
jgi:hypothetical protein